MSRSPADRVADVLTAIDRCRRYAPSLESADADLVDMAEDAVERNLQIIGEAVTHLPSDLTDAYPDIPWAQIRGFRNILVHQYFGVDTETVRDVIQSHLPPLASVLQEHDLG